MSGLPVPRPIRERPVPAALVALTLLALAMRLVELGHRVFYYDEAWFGYWILRFVDTGVWHYRPILHGPFYTRVNSAVFMLVGANDFTARLVGAVVGGLLPLSAWLFRERLRDVEVVALGVILTLNPLLLYYARFMRKDMPLAAFMLVTLGLLVRTLDTRRPRYLYAAAVTLGLAFTTKESVLLWVLTWLGAATLLLDRRLLRARDTGSGARAALASLGRRGLAGLERWWRHLLGATALFFVVVVYFYAPRAHGVPGPGLWKALGGRFGMLPAVVEDATVTALSDAIDHWVKGGKQGHPYLPYFRDTLRTLAAGAGGVCLLAAVGFLADRYSGDAPRDLVAFNFYCGAAAVVGYPLANNFPVPWSTVHAVVPFAVPAAVGAGLVVRWARGEVGADLHPDWDVPWHVVRSGLAASVLTLLVVSAGVTAVQTSFVAPYESPKGPDGGHEIVYYAQAPGDLRQGVNAIADATATGGDDVDVLYVGPRLTPPAHLSEETIGGSGTWHARMPIPWYTEALDADVASTASPQNVTAADAPPVVIAQPGVADAVANRLPTYDRRRQPLDDVADRTVVFFVKR
ncbi:MAG: flippase activity-associated protein Agl23 [Halobacteriaceae archaeon]